MKNDVSGSQEEKSELPQIIFEEESYISVAKRKIQFFLTNITLEPVMLFYGKYHINPNHGYDVTCVGL